ncbi:MAG: hypothetical protein IJU38_07160 [Clostridia bacterium]|nr:hypothetical protein [Clostridia bacterium]
MKTLDEVIFEAPYSPTPWEADALHYLKEYRSDKLQWEADKKAYEDERQKAIHATKKARERYIALAKDTKDDMTALRAFWAEQQANPPLSWDELKQMEGKPVWYEHEFWKGWIILGKVEQGVNCEMIPDREERWYIVKDGSAKAYRREKKDG